MRGPGTFEKHTHLGFGGSVAPLWYFWQGKPQTYGHVRRIHGTNGRENTKHMVLYGVYTVLLAGKTPNIRSCTAHTQYFWQGKPQTYGHVRRIHSTFGRENPKHTVMYGVYTVLLAGKTPNIWSCTAYTRYFWQGKPQTYGLVRRIHGTFGRENTKHTVMYGVYTVLLAGKTPNIWSCTAYTRYFWLGKHQTYGHVRRFIHSTFGRENPKHTVMYGVYTVLLAGKTPNIRSCTAHSQYFWQGKPQTYGHVRRIHSTFGRENTKHTVMYGVYIHHIRCIHTMALAYWRVVLTSVASFLFPSLSPVLTRSSHRRPNRLGSWRQECTWMWSEKIWPLTDANLTPFFLSRSVRIGSLPRPWKRRRLSCDPSDHHKPAGQSVLLESVAR